MAGDLLGVDVSRVEATPEFNLGAIADQSVGEFIYAQYLLLTDEGEVVILSADNQAQPMTLDGAAVMFGARIGVMRVGCQCQRLRLGAGSGRCRVPI